MIKSREKRSTGTEDLMRRLAKVSESLSEARREMDRTRGKIDALLDRMRKEFGVGSPDELREEIVRVADRVEKASIAIADGVKLLERRYGLDKY